MNTKACSKCKEVKPLSGFYYDKHKADKRRPSCKSCDNERAKKARKTIAFKIHFNPYQKIWQRTYRRTAKYKAWRKIAGEKRKEESKKLKQIVVNHYGGACKCCGINDIRFLSIDHINNDGWKEKEHRKNRMNTFLVYKKLIREGFRSDLQILCYNCNIARQHNGGVCPHKI